ncbi:MAG: hypothetical protein U1F76_02890 [Candidatus Competibacteraceae bacterium]
MAMITHTLRYGALALLALLSLSLSGMAGAQTLVTDKLTITTKNKSTNTTPADDPAAPGGTKEYPDGVYTFTATYCNNKGLGNLALVGTVTQTLTNNNGLVNRRQQNSLSRAGVGSARDFDKTGQYSDGILAPNECVDVVYRIGLKNRNRFTFLVDAYSGLPQALSAAISLVPIVPDGGTVSMLATSSGSNGTVTYSWQQTAGPDVG